MYKASVTKNTRGHNVLQTSLVKVGIRIERNLVKQAVMSTTYMLFIVASPNRSLIFSLICFI